MDVDQVSVSVHPIELAYLNEIEEVARLSQDGIKPNRRMIYFLGCTHFQPYGFVLKEGKQVVGFILAFPDGTGEQLWIHQIAVHPDHRRKGYGAQLMQAVCEMAEKEGGTSLRLAVNPNSQALAWYQRLGFTPIKQSPEIQMTIMEKPLSQP